MIRGVTNHGEYIISLTEGYIIDNKKMKSSIRCLKLQTFLCLSIFIMLSHASPLCNSFPKILGGAIGESAIMQIDVFGDYLALAGYTYDTGLTS